MLKIKRKSRLIMQKQGKVLRFRWFGNLKLLPRVEIQLCPSIMQQSLQALKILLVASLQIKGRNLPKDRRTRNNRPMWKEKRVERETNWAPKRKSKLKKLKLKLLLLWKSIHRKPQSPTRFQCNISLFQPLQLNQFQIPSISYHQWHQSNSTKCSSTCSGNSRWLTRCSSSCICSS